MRLGREGEASEILDKVLEARPTDEGALNAMTIAFRELQVLLGLKPQSRRLVAAMRSGYRGKIQNGFTMDVKYDQQHQQTLCSYQVHVAKSKLMTRTLMKKASVRSY